MPLINGSNPRDRAGLMIEDFVCHMRRNPQPGHPGHAGPAQIVEPPSSHPRELIESTFGMVKSWNGLFPSNVKTNGLAVCAFQYDHCLFRQVDDCSLAFFVRALGIVQIRQRGPAPPTESATSSRRCPVSAKSSTMPP